MTNDAISLGVWRQGQGPVDLTPEQEAAGRATAAAISLHVAKAKLASLPKPKQLDKRIAGLEQQIDALIAGLEAIDPGGGEAKTQLAFKVADLIEEQLNLTKQRVDRFEWEDAIRLYEIMREASHRGLQKGDRMTSRRTPSKVAQGMPDCSDCTCMLVCVFDAHPCTRDRGCSKHPAFPAPSFSRETPFKTRALRAAGQAHLCVFGCSGTGLQWVTPSPTAVPPRGPSTPRYSC
jgi:hypothetical protein